MIEEATGYLLAVATIAAFFGIWERRSRAALFEYLPAVVLIYAAAMLLAQSGVWGRNAAIDAAYATARNNLLPAMLFLMMLQVDLRHFARLGRPLLLAYASAVLSLAAAFVLVFWLFGFDYAEAGLFAALCGSWMGGTANMLAVGGALGTSETMMGYAFVTDAVNYTFWVVMLLALVRAAPRFNRWSRAASSHDRIETPGCACTVGPKRYWLLVLLSLLVAFAAQSVAPWLPWLGTTTWMVLVATLIGLAASHTPLKTVNGSGEIASTMLLLLVALIGSRADFGGWESVPSYLFAGFTILMLHAAVMVGAAKVFKLDLFSIGVASLANIGGVASAPILAAAYGRSLIGIAVLMAVMGYLIGTFGGLAVGYFLQRIAT